MDDYFLFSWNVDCNVEARESFWESCWDSRAALNQTGAGGFRQECVQGPVRVSRKIQPRGENVQMFFSSSLYH